MHLYYRAPQDPLLRNSISRLGPRIDTRGAGGYIVAAGSILTTGRYRIVDDRPPIRHSDWLITAMTPAPQLTASNSRPTARRRTSPKRSPTNALGSVRQRPAPDTGPCY
ncbi:bifunctional DNA primase/polymerase [Nocardia sp. NPDC049526]|uniref:bifunctional DNA primase/polymerase n=1 Tax=Nocardia sp. NPDC049526 TaxID=3364316 RepID=UPI00379AE91C